MTGNAGGELGEYIGFKSGPMRMGILAESEFSASLSSDQAMAMDIAAESVVSFTGQQSHPMALIAEGASEPFSDLFQAVGVFTVPTEPFWGTVWEGGAVASDRLIDNYQHSQTPVKYIRLDDITLEYTGSQLTRVTKEEGDDKVLEYSGAQLVRVTDSYHGIVKDLSYNGNQLTGVTVSKIV